MRAAAVVFDVLNGNVRIVLLLSLRTKRKAKHAAVAEKTRVAVRHTGNVLYVLRDA